MRLLTFSLVVLAAIGFAHLPENAGTVKRLGSMLLSELGTLSPKTK